MKSSKSTTKQAAGKADSIAKGKGKGIELDEKALKSVAGGLSAVKKLYADSRKK